MTDLFDPLPAEKLAAPKPTTATVMVSSQTALRWLDRNVRNRPLSPITVAKYARDMSSGQWLFTADPIRFDIDGNLIDGQHRLAAIAECEDLALPMLVVRGLPAETQFKMDQGRRRSTHQQLAMKGVPNATNVAAAVRLYIAWQEGFLFRDNRQLGMISSPQIEGWLDDHPDELALFTPGPLVQPDGKCKQITAETCIHFLRFDRADYAALGNLIKCNPAIKDAGDREALIKALVDDVVDVLATDHAPHTLEEKGKPYVQAPSGLPLVQYALVAALELVHEGRMDVARVVQKFAHAPAQLFDVKERGYLREGYFADLVLIDDEPFTVKREDVLSKVGWSPFEGRTFRSRIGATWVNGRMVWNGQHLVGTPNGQRLEFAR